MQMSCLNFFIFPQNFVVPEIRPPKVGTFPIKTHNSDAPSSSVWAGVGTLRKGTDLTVGDRIFSKREINCHCASKYYDFMN